MNLRFPTGAVGYTFYSRSVDFFRRILCPPRVRIRYKNTAVRARYVTKRAEQSPMFNEAEPSHDSSTESGGTKAAAVRLSLGLMSTKRITIEMIPSVREFHF
jgi:hypothetical protein